MSVPVPAPCLCPGPCREGPGCSAHHPRPTPGRQQRGGSRLCGEPRPARSSGTARPERRRGKTRAQPVSPRKWPSVPGGGGAVSFLPSVLLGPLVAPCLLGVLQGPPSPRSPGTSHGSESLALLAHWLLSAQGMPFHPRQPLPLPAAPLRGSLLRPFAQISPSQGHLPCSLAN